MGLFRPVAGQLFLLGTVRLLESSMKQSIIQYLKFSATVDLIALYSSPSRPENISDYT